MPQGIFAWQGGKLRGAHPKGERETGRRPRERESTFLGEKPVPDASGEGLSLCGSLGQERGKKSYFGGRGRRVLFPMPAGRGKDCAGHGARSGDRKTTLEAKESRDRPCSLCHCGEGCSLSPQKKGKGKGLGSISQAFPSFRGGGAALSRGLYYFNESFP